MRRDAGLAVENTRQHVSGDAQVDRRLGHGPPLGLKRISYDSAGMRRIVHTRHLSLPLVVVGQVHADGLSFVEHEDNTPVSGYLHTPLAKPVSFQRMQAPSRRSEPLTMYVARQCTGYRGRENGTKTRNPSFPRKRESKGGGGSAVLPSPAPPRFPLSRE